MSRRRAGRASYPRTVQNDPLNLHRPYTPSPLSDLLEHSFVWEDDISDSQIDESQDLVLDGTSGRNVDHIIHTLRGFGLFTNAPRSCLHLLARKLKPHLYTYNDEIIVEGEESRAIYFLIRGIVEVISKDGESRYAKLEPGAFFGEIGVLFSTKRTASVVARGKCLALSLQAEDLWEHATQFSYLAQSIREEAEVRLRLLQLKNGRRKSEDDSLELYNGDTVLGSTINLRRMMLKVPILSELPLQIQHSMAMEASARSYDPFVTIIEQGSLSPEREIFFIISGSVEVVKYTQDRKHATVKARLGPSKFFGEFAFFNPDAGRTASVKAITRTVCLVVTGNIIARYAKLFQRLEQHLGDTKAERELDNISSEEDFTDSIQLRGLDADPFMPVHGEAFLVEGKDESSAAISSAQRRHSSLRKSSTAMFDVGGSVSQIFEYDAGVPEKDMESTGMGESEYMSHESTKGSSLWHNIEGSSKNWSPAKVRQGHLSTTQDNNDPNALVSFADSDQIYGRLPSAILKQVFSHFSFGASMRMRRVCRSWYDLLLRTPELCNHVNLAEYNTRILDKHLPGIVRFANNRARIVDLSCCFHISDDGFRVLLDGFAARAEVWKMQSLWEISGSLICKLFQRATSLRHIDLANCRKVGDVTLMRGLGRRDSTYALTQPVSSGSGHISELNLSYCKHVSDRTLAHLASHTSDTLSKLSLTRCTGVTDGGFQAWLPSRFPKLHTLILADCSFLTDKAITALSIAAPFLRSLDLSFCCSLSDGAVETVSLGLPSLVHLDLSFCGSAVSDNSLSFVAMRLNNLKCLKIKGCARVTSFGINVLLDGCGYREEFPDSGLCELDIVQCKNAQNWLERTTDIFSLRKIKIKGDQELGFPSSAMIE